MTPANVMASSLREQFGEINFHPRLNYEFRERGQREGDKENRDGAATRE